MRDVRTDCAGQSISGVCRFDHEFRRHGLQDPGSKIPAPLKGPTELVERCLAFAPDVPEDDEFVELRKRGTAMSDELAKFLAACQGNGSAKSVVSALKDGEVKPARQDSFEN